MGQTFQQLGHLFLETIPTVVLVFLLFVILDRILFRPLASVMKQREELTVGALARARDDASAAAAKTGEYEAAFQSARQEVYRQREADRQSSLRDRDAALRAAREKAEAVIQEAHADLAKELEHVKAELDATCEPLAEEISQSLVGPGSLSGGGERLPR